MPVKSDRPDSRIFDLVVAGAGPSGLMAALQAAKAGLKVAVLERNSLPARKFAMLRRGLGSLSRSDISHEHLRGRHERFASDALEAFDLAALRRFFRSLEVELIEEEGRWLPATRSGVDAAVALVVAAERASAQIHCDTSILRVNAKPGGFDVQTSRGDYHARHLVLALGGPHFPQLGATESGFKFARHLGLAVEPPRPALVGLRTREIWPFRLPGLWMECRASLMQEGRLLREAEGLVLFTAGALVGPAIAALSRDVDEEACARGEVCLRLNFYPELGPEDVAQWLFRTLGQHTRMLAPDALDRMLPRRLAVELCRVADINPRWRVNRLSESQRKRLEGLLTDTGLTVTQSLGWRAAEGSRGGVNVRKVNPRTFECRSIAGLHVVGEMLDVDAPSAEMNIHFALASGWCAGTALAAKAPKRAARKKSVKR